MFPHLKGNKNLFFLIMTILQLTIILSQEGEEKCYSILHCISCPELDFCVKCKTGFILNEPKTKCFGTSNYQSYYHRAPINRTLDGQNNNVINGNINNNPFQNVPISSLQKFKEKDINNEIINKILIFILIILVLSIISSVIYNLVRKRMGGGYTEDMQDESAKVVYIR